MGNGNGGGPILGGTPGYSLPLNNYSFYMLLLEKRSDLERLGYLKSLHNRERAKELPLGFDQHTLDKALIGGNVWVGCWGLPPTL